MLQWSEYYKKRPKRRIKGMFKCHSNNCTACPFIAEKKEIKQEQAKPFVLNKKFNCNSANIIYMIECKKDKCKQRYIGYTTRKLKKRLAEHRGYVVNRHINRVTGFHFNQPGHSVSDLTITILGQVISTDRQTEVTDLEEKERYFIKKFNTITNGLNGRYPKECYWPSKNTRNKDYNTIANELRMKYSNKIQNNKQA